MQKVILSIISWGLTQRTPLCAHTREATDEKTYLLIALIVALILSLGVWPVVRIILHSQHVMFGLNKWALLRLRSLTPEQVESIRYDAQVVTYRGTIKKFVNLFQHDLWLDKRDASPGRATHKMVVYLNRKPLGEYIIFNAHYRPDDPTAVSENLRSKHFWSLVRKQSTK